MRLTVVVFAVLLPCLLTNIVQPATLENIQKAKQSKKNILFMLCDDGGFEFDFYPENGKGSETPNLSALAKKGTIFDNAFTAVSSCSPSRSSILSGLPTHQNGMFGLHNMDVTFNSHEHVYTLPTILDDHGYYTGIIGKYHVGPDYKQSARLRTPLYRLYNFSFGLQAGDMPNGGCCSNSRSCPLPYNTLARNITHMKECATQFLHNANKLDKPFMLYIGWGDAHRCHQTNEGKSGPLGYFCTDYGNGVGKNGTIPDWKPKYYNPKDIIVPWHQPDTPAARMEISKQWTAINRMDQGIGLVLKELEKSGHMDDTLIMYFADNGIPFPGAKTQHYDPGIREPLVVYNPLKPTNGLRNQALISSLDFLPTILDWAGIPLPTHFLDGKRFTYEGKSILPILDKTDSAEFDHVWCSHSFHPVYGYFPMRVLRKRDFKLILNIAGGGLQLPILNDVWTSATWQDMAKRYAQGGQPETKWFRDFHAYQFERPKWELFDLRKNASDGGRELINLADDPQYQTLFKQMQAELKAFQARTEDPWIKKYIHE